MAHLRVSIADMHFSGQWVDGAPETIKAIRSLLPLHSQLIHCRWSGEGCWIPFGRLILPVGPEHATSHPAPGQFILYPGGISECEILVAYGAVDFSSKVGQLAGNHFATLTTGLEQLPELGRRVLWEGAQPISIDEDATAR